MVQRSDQNLWKYSDRACRKQGKYRKMMNFWILSQGRCQRQKSQSQTNNLPQKTQSPILRYFSQEQLPIRKALLVALEKTCWVRNPPLMIFFLISVNFSDPNLYLVEAPSLLPQEITMDPSQVKKFLIFRLYDVFLDC